jgi:hypothetical protein
METLINPLSVIGSADVLVGFYEQFCRRDVGAPK